MIKIFRTIRFQHMKHHQTAKYLKYALGEIILVVIGILIALQINNWNEHRKLQNSIQQVYSMIKTDLQSDIKTIGNVLSEMTPRDSIFSKSYCQAND